MATAVVGADPYLGVTGRAICPLVAEGAGAGAVVAGASLLAATGVLNTAGAGCAVGAVISLGALGAMRTLAIGGAACKLCATAIDWVAVAVRAAALLAGAALAALAVILRVQARFRVAWWVCTAAVTVLLIGAAL